MDEKEQNPVAGEGVSADLTANQGDVLQAPVVPDAQEEKPQGMADASQILAPQKEY